MLTINLHAILGNKNYNQGTQAFCDIKIYLVLEISQGVGM
jgi:hypothetical protein